MENEGTIRTVVIDDHELLRSGIGVILKRSANMEVVGGAATGSEGMKAIEEHSPDVVVLDVKLPDANGIELTKEISQRWPETKVLVISADLLKYLIDQAVSAGAHGAMLKESVYAELIDAIQSVYEGKRYFCTRVKEIIAIDWAGRLQTDKSASISSLNSRLVSPSLIANLVSSAMLLIPSLFIVSRRLASVVLTLT